MADVRAGGGVVLRRKGDKVKVVIIHRPAYGDWTLPKGKLDPGESYRQGALREVEEETGLVCTATNELSSIRYRDGRGRTKKVRYWLMQATDGHSVRDHVDDEIDDVRWVGIDKARRMLSYPHDIELLDEALAQFREAT